MIRRTPVSKKGLESLDHLKPEYAIVKAWIEPGNHPAWHEACKRELRQSMPLLARALDRLERNSKLGPIR